MDKPGTKYFTCTNRYIIGGSCFMEQLTVKYYYHSGFSVACGETLLVFDYWMGRRGAKLPEAQRITAESLSHFDEVYVFISHGHEDHFDPIVYTWEQFAPVTYILPDTMDASLHGRRMGIGGELELSKHVKVKAFDSTDEGLSYLVTIDGISVFHAGDLNNWHWREESTPHEIEEAERDFLQVMDTLRGQKIDIAFFPVDPRLGMMFDAGPNYFAMVMKPRLMIPMHFWERTEVIREYAKRSRSQDTEYIAMTKPGDMMLIEFDDQGGVTVHVQTADNAPVSKNKKVALQAYDGENPFSDSDLPVDLD